MGDQAPAQVAQRGCGVPYLGDIQEHFGPSWATSPRWSCLSKGLDQMPSKGAFQPWQFCDSVRKQEIVPLCKQCTQIQMMQSWRLKSCISQRLHEIHMQNTKVSVSPLSFLTMRSFIDCGIALQASKLILVRCWRECTAGMTESLPGDSIRSMNMETLS